MKTSVIMLLIVILAGCAERASDGEKNSSLNGDGGNSTVRYEISKEQLNLLLEAQPGTVYNVNAPSFRQRRPILDELQRNGYVSLKEVVNGSDRFMIVERSKKGEALAQKYYENGAQ